MIIAPIPAPPDACSTQPTSSAAWISPGYTVWWYVSSLIVRIPVSTAIEANVSAA
jgi:hypothetical protein